MRHFVAYHETFWWQIAYFTTKTAHGKWVQYSVKQQEVITWTVVLPPYMATNLHFGPGPHKKWALFRLLLFQKHVLTLSTVWVRRRIVLQQPAHGCTTDEPDVTWTKCRGSLGTRSIHRKAMTVYETWYGRHRKDVTVRKSTISMIPALGFQAQLEANSDTKWRRKKMSIPLTFTTPVSPSGHCLNTCSFFIYRMPS